MIARTRVQNIFENLLESGNVYLQYETRQLQS
jgi:hypothetical protein